MFDAKVREALIEAIQRYQFHTGRIQAVMWDGTIPATSPMCEQVVLLKETLERFRDDLEMLVWFAAAVTGQPVHTVCAGDLLAWLVAQRIKREEGVE